MSSEAVVSSVEISDGQTTVRFGSLEEAKDALAAAEQPLAGNERTAKYTEREDLRDLAARLVEKFPGRLGNVYPTQIAFLSNSDDMPRNKGRACMAKTFRLSARYEFLTGYTHVVEFYPLNCGHLSDRQLTILLYHELLHIGEEGKLQGHDVEEFGEVIDTFGREVLDYRNERLPDILDETFDWGGIRRPTLFDAQEAAQS